MYLDHFGLAEPPFRITPHTDFFFSGANRGATLNALLYAITNDEGIVKVSGEVGSGKTMLCRVLMERLPENIDIVYLANPSLSREDILCAICDEMGLTVAADARASAVLRTLQEKLVALHGQGRQVVVLIDEAHAMPPETLEEIRLLSNLESNRNKLLQLVLFGQPELNEILARPNMRQLKERITHNFMLEPLVRTDITEYLDFRMRAAGYRGPEVFGPEAVKLIDGASLGLTRRVNILADKALLAAFASGSHQITSKEVKAAIQDTEFATAVGPSSRRTFGMIGLGAGIGLLAMAVFALRGQHSGDTAPSAPASAAVSIPATPVAVVPNPDEASRATSVAPPTAQAAPAPAAPPVPAPATPTANPAPIAIEDHPQATAKPAQPPASPASSATAPVAEAAGGATASLDDWPELGPVTRQRALKSTDWLTSTPDEQWFLQLIRTDITQAPRVEGVAALASRLLRREQVRVYAVNLNGSRRIGVIYGEFSSQADALVAAAKLPRSLRALNPYPRQVKRLR